MDIDQDEKIFHALEENVFETFPVLRDIKFTHRWGGPVSVPLDMAPALGYLGDKRVVYALGSMGHGVSLTHLNGCTIADLILERETDLTQIFFVNRRTIPWPGEPLRFVLSHAIKGYMKIEDRLYDPKGAEGS
jgi:glycine/D-amino acid oxidase-like deaminating enzyme